MRELKALCEQAAEFIDRVQSWRSPAGWHTPDSPGDLAVRLRAAAAALADASAVSLRTTVERDGWRIRAEAAEAALAAERTARAGIEAALRALDMQAHLIDAAHRADDIGNAGKFTASLHRQIAKALSSPGSALAARDAALLRVARAAKAFRDWDAVGALVSGDEPHAEDAQNDLRELDAALAAFAAQKGG